MQSDSLPQSAIPLLPFDHFLSTLLSALEAEEIRPCILRNYEGFPHSNAGNDVDFLIRPSELSRALRALQSIPNIRITGQTKLCFIVSCFLQGTSASTGGRSIQVDFFHRLSWKGLAYLPVESVLASARRVRAGDLHFFVPSPVHEAIDSLLASLLVGGWLKGKYLPKITFVFANNRSAVIEAMRQPFGRPMATRLVDAVINGDNQAILACVRPLRRSLALRSLMHHPLRAATAALGHYKYVFSLRYAPRTIETVCILGCDETRQNDLIGRVLPLLQSSAKAVEYFQSPSRALQKHKQRFSCCNRSLSAAIPSILSSMGVITLWLMKEWMHQIFSKRNLTLRLRNNGFHDLLIDPQRIPYNGPSWYARWIAALSPPVDLFIYLDENTDVTHVANRNSPQSQRMDEVRNNQISSLARKSRVVRLNALRTTSQLGEDSYEIIVQMLVQRTTRQWRE